MQFANLYLNFKAAFFLLITRQAVYCIQIPFDVYSIDTSTQLIIRDGSATCGNAFYLRFLVELQNLAIF